MYSDSTSVLGYINSEEFLIFNCFYENWATVDEGCMGPSVQLFMDGVHTIVNSHDIHRLPVWFDKKARELKKFVD